MTTSEYNECVKRLADDLYRYAARLAKDQSMAQDIVQDVFEKIWKRKEEIRIDEARQYLFRTTYTTSMDYLRKMKTNQQHTAQQSASSDLAKGHVRFELQDILHQALEKLSDIQRSLILLRDYEGYSYQEIGSITGLSESQVKVYIFRGRKALKSIIKQVNYHE